jgi:hypothetical protein
LPSKRALNSKQRWLGTALGALVVGSFIAHGCRLYESGSAADVGEAGVDGTSPCTLDCDAGADGAIACATGSASCDNDPSVCETDTTSDPANCGGCGHDCLGAACSAGFCAPSVLAMRSGSRSILRTDDGLYFTTTDGGATGEVLFLPLLPDGGLSPDGGVVVLAVGQENPNGLSADGTFVYWGNLLGTSVMRAPRHGEGAASSIADAQPGPIDTVVDDGHIYWANIRDVPDAGGIHRALKDGGEHVVLAASGPGSRALVGDAVDLYWVNDVDHTILKVARDGGAAAVLASRVNGDAATPAAGGPLFLTLGSGVLYVAVDGTDAGIYSLPTTGLAADAAPEPIVTKQSTLRGLVADAKYVYFTRAAEGTVLRATRDGGVVEVLAKDQPFPFAIALDDRAIYWVNVGAGADGGTLMRLAK